MARPYRFAAAVVVLCVILAHTGCVKAKKTTEPKTSELVPHWNRSLSGGTIICDAWFTTESDPNTMVTLEDDAIMTCDSYVMIRSGPFFSGGTAYTSGKEVPISLIRRIDGSTLTDTQIFY